MAASDFLRARWPLLTVMVAGGAILAIAVMLWRTLPPRTIVMATGAEGGAYYEVGKRYREIFARAGVELRLVSTGGAL